MVWEKGRMGGTHPSLFLGWRIQTQGEFLAKILYRQVHWCAALFCTTSPEQAKIPHNRPNFSVLDISGRAWVRGAPAHYTGAVQTKQTGHFLPRT